MTTAITCAISAIVMAMYVLIKFLRARAKVDSANFQSFNRHDYYMKPIVFLAAFVVIGLVYVISGFMNKNDINKVIGAAIAVFGLIEIVYFRYAFVFYYRNNKCIINNQMVDYNSIKSVECNKKGLFSKGKVTLYNSKEYDLYHECCEIIRREMASKR